MDLGTAPLFDLTAPAAEAEPVAVDRSDELLAEIRDHRAVVAEREIATLRAIAEWAGEHVVDDEANAATITERGLDTGLPVAGPGAPLISDFAVMELSALAGPVVGLGSQLRRAGRRACPPAPAGSGRRVLDGEVAVWKALRIADNTRLLPADAAAFVDRQLAPYAHGCTWAQVDRLVEEALVRYDPEAAEERRREAQEHRHVDLGLDQVGYDGIAYGTTAMDVADALDLEQAIARRAKLNGQLGDEDSLDVRRAKALGEIAREDLILDLEVVDPDTGEITRTVPGRKTELMLHISPLPTRPSGGSATPAPRSRWSRSRPGSTCPNTSVIVRPVIDLNGNQAVDSYEIPDRIRRHVTERDHHCVFPYCGKPVESCDIDHIKAYADEPGNVHRTTWRHPCRGHHRMKTAGQRVLPDAPPRHLPLDPALRHLPRRPHRHLPPHRDRHRPTRPRSSYPAPNPATGGAIGMPETWQGSRDGRQSDLLDQRWSRPRRPAAARP